MESDQIGVQLQGIQHLRSQICGARQTAAFCFCLLVFSAKTRRCLYFSYCIRKHIWLFICQCQLLRSGICKKTQSCLMFLRNPMSAHGQFFLLCCWVVGNLVRISPIITLLTESSRIPHHQVWCFFCFWGISLCCPTPCRTSRKTTGQAIKKCLAKSPWGIIHSDLPIATSLISGGLYLLEANPILIYSVGEDKPKKRTVLDCQSWTHLPQVL